MNEIDDDAHLDPEQEWSLHALHVVNKSSWLMSWFQRFTGKTSYSTIFRRMAEEISHSRLLNFSQVKQLIDLKDSVHQLSSGYYTKTGQVAAFLGGHGDVPASVEELGRSIDARLLRLFTGSTLQPNEINPEARILARNIYDGLANTKATKANLQDFESFLRSRLPLNFRRNGREFYQKFAQLGFPVAQYRYGEICEHAGNAAEAKRWYELSAKQGMLRAIRRLQQVSYRELAPAIPERTQSTGAVEVLTGLTGVQSLSEAMAKGTEFLGRVDPDECAELRSLKTSLEGMQHAGMSVKQKASFIVANLFLYGAGVARDTIKAIDYGLQSGVIRWRASESGPVTNGRIAAQEGCNMIESLLVSRKNVLTPANIVQAVQLATLFDCCLYLWALNDASFYEYISKVLYPLSEAETRDFEAYANIVTMAARLILNVATPSQADLDMMLVLLRHFQQMQRPAGPGATAWRAKPH